MTNQEFLVWSRSFWGL